MRKSSAWFLVLLLAAASAPAGDLSFSDPARVTPPPAWAVGQASRAADLDALPGFQKPPPGFGIVPFFWWIGDPLTRERLGWQLDQMEGMGMSGYQINYCHGDKGGLSWGLSTPSDPPLFSEAWWELVDWFMQKAKKQGAGISLSDYTLGLGQGWCMDEVVREHPEVLGSVLQMQGDKVVPVTVPHSINPMHPLSGKAYVDKFYGQFERRAPGEGGRGLNFFFSDELELRVAGNLWSPAFAEEFQKRKGYDITPELPALFKDIGPRTPKIRLDYSDVKVALSEEHFFKPLFDWHQQRGMTMGCDHGGRGRNVIEFGDYFRTQRWLQGPGADQPNLGKDLIKAKVASSIAHLYRRPRVWLEGYYGSGWGTTPAGIVDATFANFAMGFNLLSYHGMYYSTHGGWWEWAPPDNTFRMPYWKHLRGFSDCVQRLSYLLAQGEHRCDVAILYPVAPMEAGMGGPEAVNTAFHAGETLYAQSVDFDFMDFESLARAKVVGRELHVAGEAYRVLVLPAMRAVRHSTLEKAAEFRRAGGVVVALGALPEASDRMGRDDPEVAALVKELFPEGPAKDLFAALPPRDYEGRGYVLHRKIGSRDLYVLYNAPQGLECGFRATGRVELWDPWTGAVRPLSVVSQSAEGTRLQLPLGEKELQLIVFSPGKAEVRAPAPEKPAEVVKVEGDWEFELQPTSDNRFGDFHWPPTPALIGAEVRQLAYSEGDPEKGPWRRVTCSFGPQFLRTATLPADTMKPPPDGQPYEFSWRWGIEGDPGHQGYHGLKQKVYDEFLAVPGAGTYFWTTVVAPRAMKAKALSGGLKPAKVWLNGAVVTGSVLDLKAGANPLLLEYDRPGRTYFVVSTQGEAGADEEIFSPAASWIWYPQGQTMGACWFRKSFDLAKAPPRARLRITCDNGYRVSVNGRDLGEGSRWETVQEYDVTKALRAGRNEIVVHARNEGDSAGLIAELTAGTTRVATDRTWQAARSETGDAVGVELLSSFTDSLWYKHPQGPIRLDPVAGDAPAPKVSPLAMRWWKDPSVLPFDMRPQVQAPVGWYRFISPPGFRGMTVPTCGRVQAWAGGTPMRQQADPGGPVRLSVPQPSPEPVTVLLRIDSLRCGYGGAALLEPIQLDVGPGLTALGDWSKNDSLLSYSGGAWYRKTIRLPAGRNVTLDLGQVAASAEVRVNGKTAAVKVSPPWAVDITRFVKPGENRIEVLVCNTLANHYTTVPTNYRGSVVSGLLGPVTVRLTEP